MLDSVEWGEFKFNDGLFEFCKVRNKLSKEHLDKDGKTPVYSSDSTNNGIIGYTNKKPEFVVSQENQLYVVFGDHTRSFNVATDSFCVADNVKVLRVNNIIQVNSLLFITAAWKKCIPNKGYSRHWGIAKEVMFKLPVKNGEIDFDLMERFIVELEAVRIAKLEAYLSSAGLKDYRLTPEEQKALDDYQGIEFSDFKVTDVFTVKNSGNILSRDIVENSGDTPYLCASRENNSVSSYISYDNKYLDRGNCVFIGGKTFVVTYQEEDFYSNDSHNLILYLKNKDQRNKLNQLYLVTCVDKSLRHRYSWGDSISNRKIQKDVISLPTKRRKVDISSMATLISAVQKLVIKDLVQYVDQKIAAYEQAVKAS